MSLTAKQLFLEKFIRPIRPDVNIERRRAKVDAELARLPDGDRKAMFRTRMEEAARLDDKNRTYRDLNAVKADVRQSADAHAESITKEGVEERVLQFERAGYKSAVTKDALTRTQRRMETAIQEITGAKQKATPEESAAELRALRAAWNESSDTWQTAIREFEGAKPEGTHASLVFDIGILGNKPGLAGDARVLESRASSAKVSFQRDGVFLSAEALKARFEVEKERFDRLFAARERQSPAGAAVAQVRSRLGAIRERSHANLLLPSGATVSEKLRQIEALLADYRIGDAQRELGALAGEMEIHEATELARSEASEIAAQIRSDMKLGDGKTVGEKLGVIGRLLDEGALKRGRGELAALKEAIPFAVRRPAAAQAIEAAMANPWKKRQLIGLVQAMDDAVNRGNKRAAAKMLDEVLAIARLSDKQIAQRVKDAAATVLPSKPNEDRWKEDHAEWQRKADLSTYKIARTGGSGGMGTIHFLESSKPDSPKLVLKTGRGLKHEAQMYDRVGPHPNIARCLGVQRVGDEKGLVLEALSGGDMSDAIAEMNALRKSGKLREQDYWGIMQYTLTRTLEALAYMEKKGVVHEDVKPPNIVLDAETGEPKLVDVGISVDVGAQSPQGTPGYHPDDRTPATSKEDTFAVGASAFEVQQGNTGKDLAKVFAYGDRVLRGGYMWMAQASAYRAPKQGLNVSADTGEVFDKDSRGNPVKKLGVYGAETAYVEFVNWLLHPDPAKRPTPAEALQHPFMQQRMLDDEAARRGIKDVIDGRKRRPAPDPEKLLDELRGLLADPLVSNVEQLAKEAPRAVKVVEALLKRPDDKSADLLPKLRDLLKRFSQGSGALVDLHSRVDDARIALLKQTSSDSAELGKQARAQLVRISEILKQLAPAIRAIENALVPAETESNTAAEHRKDMDMDLTVRKIEEAAKLGFAQLESTLKTHGLGAAAKALTDHRTSVQEAFARARKGAEVDFDGLVGESKAALRVHLQDPVLDAVAKAFASVVIKG
jgi:serine/threonine protein kinase